MFKIRFKAGSEMYNGRRDFKVSNFNRVLALISIVVFPFFAVGTYLSQGWSFWSLVLSAGSLLAVAGVADAFSSYLEIKDDEIEFRRNFVRKVVLKRDIEKATWAKGCPVYLLMFNGSKVELPQLNGNSLSNSINAWVRQ